jgi:hypothetical protein
VALLVVNAGLAYRNTRQLLEDAGWLAHLRPTQGTCPLGDSEGRI